MTISKLRGDRAAGVSVPDDGRWRRWLSLLLGVLVIAGIAGAASYVGTSGLKDAEKQRLAERVKFVEQVNHFAGFSYVPETMSDSVVHAPFSPTDLGFDKSLLEVYRNIPVGDLTSVTALLDRSGRPIALAPAGATLDYRQLGSAWTNAVNGKPDESNVFDDRGQSAAAFVLPVGVGSKPWAVLVEVLRSKDMSGGTFFTQVGSLNSAPGGLYAIDRRGVAQIAWDSQQVGTQVFDPATLSTLNQTAPRTWISQSPQGPMVNIGMKFEAAYAIVFQQSEAGLYGDLRQEQGHRDGILLALLAITGAALIASHLLSERASRRGRARLSALLANAQDLLLVVEEGARLRFVSPSAASLLGRDPATWQGSNLLAAVHPDDRARVAGLLGEPGLNPSLLNVRLLDGNNEVHYFDFEASDRGDHPEIRGILITCHEADQRKKLEDELSRQASHDALTGLANRARLADTMERLAGRSCTVVYVDLDDFKPVNDTLGHDAGDRVLRVVAHRLSALVGRSGLVARLGGDEFVALLPGTDERTAHHFGQRVIASIREPILTPLGQTNVDASVGIALGDAKVHPETLLRLADQAMYQSKAAGKGSVSLRTSTGDGFGAFGGPNANGGIGDGLAAAAPAYDPHASHLLLGSDPSHAPRRAWSRRVLDVVPMLIAASVVIGLGAVDVLQETTARHHAEQTRRVERTALTQRIGDFAATVVDPKRLVGPVATAPWDLTNPTLCAGLAQVLTNSAAGGPGSVVVVAKPDGSVVATAGLATDLIVPTTDPSWTEALQGTPNLAGVVGEAPNARIAFVVPISSQGKTIGVVEIGQSLQQGLFQRTVQAVGSLGMGAGGLSVVDHEGNAAVSYDPDLIGTPLVDPSAVAGLAVGQVRQTTAPDGSVTIMTPVATIQGAHPYFAVFQQPVSAFYGDIRIGQLLRDASLLLLVVIAVGGLAIAQWRRERSARRDRDRLDALLQNAHDIVMVLDRSGSPRFVSSAAQRLLDRRTASVLGAPLAEIVHPEDRERFLSWLGENSASDGRRPSLHDIRLLTGTGDARWFDIECTDLRNNPAIGGLLLTCHDSGVRKDLQDKLSYQARHDMLTGLPHRGIFVRDLDALAVAPGNPAFAVLFVDLDHFKPVNDAFGHAAGDQVLSTVARRLEQAGMQGSRVYRLGGDEFAVIVLGADRNRAAAAAEHALTAIRQPQDIDGHTVRIDATIGIALSTGTPGGISAVARQADAAMYQAKQQGRGRYAFA